MGLGEMRRAQNVNASELNADVFLLTDNPLLPNASQYKVMLAICYRLAPLTTKAAQTGHVGGRRRHKSKTGLHIDAMQISYR